ncbi:hypothetical protein SDC9_135276 [bioreactor metagenome]|uniref:Uncharacterized protein n=1 Tax=bioreactor metagenome TaxID=1076179 RepID=A0A645DG25_9ZZZZ
MRHKTPLVIGVRLSVSVVRVNVFYDVHEIVNRPCLVLYHLVRIGKIERLKSILVKYYAEAKVFVKKAYISCRKIYLMVN